MEAEAIAKVIILGEATGARVHVAHLTTAEGLGLIEQAKAAGKTVTAETCPQYLTLTARGYEEAGPLREDESALEVATGCCGPVEGNYAGVIDMVASDHGPYVKGG